MARKPVDHYVTDLPAVAISFDVEAFDSAIRSQGVRLIHYKALRCPVGMTDIDDNRRPHEDHSGCSNGFLYRKAGTITGLLIGNGNDPQLRDIGFVDGASFTSTFPRAYDEACTPEKPFYLAPFDRFYLDEEAILVPTWQLVRANEAGIDRTNFPVVEVEELVDNRGDSYEEYVDFKVVDGSIQWIPGGRRPMPDLETGRGAVFSVRYRYRPFWYVGRLLHEIRISQVDNPMTNERKLVRMQQQALLNREFLFLNESNDDMAKDPRNTQGPSRQQQAPEDGGFGPR